ncbi:hypothetical protein M501DRAFT_924677 [Patellaria atrata CBS 101060]|uniref:Uncharacterized protein n=1 Tax=Patellaria atrata CBS 101060 TaxID=1346257 RepID=A0A9P4SJ46_9PEZI|nr:hypothetical protein M501DRAFT_924677 [Patellaria atrata CBS 101060]
MSQISTTSRRTSTNPGEKALPMSPPTLSSTDLVSSLEAQLEDLALQRRNLQKVMRDIQNLRAQSPVVVGFKVMRETGTKLKQLEEDLADVRQMEHEVGLRLHRAWKRKEECEGAEPSAFWVRRVTG